MHKISQREDGLEHTCTLSPELVPAAWVDVEKDWGAAGTGLPVYETPALLVCLRICSNLRVAALRSRKVPPVIAAISLNSRVRGVPSVLFRAMVWRVKSRSRSIVLWTRSLMSPEYNECDGVKSVYLLIGQEARQK